VRQPPIEFPQMVFHMLWHDRSHHSPMRRWLREIIMQARNRIAASVSE
jgi:DNA-binding transcriptional LysR family regulator